MIFFVGFPSDFKISTVGFDGILVVLLGFNGIRWYFSMGISWMIYYLTISQVAFPG